MAYYPEFQECTSKWPQRVTKAGKRLYNVWQKNLITKGHIYTHPMYLIILFSKAWYVNYMDG